MYNEKYLKTKIKFYDSKINTNFLDNGIPKEGSHYVCLSVFLIHCVFNMSNHFYQQVILEECRYVVKKKIDEQVY